MRRLGEVYLLIYFVQLNAENAHYFDSLIVMSLTGSKSGRTYA